MFMIFSYFVLQLSQSIPSASYSALNDFIVSKSNSISLSIQLNTVTPLAILFVWTDKPEILLCLILNIEYIYNIMHEDEQRRQTISEIF